MKKLSWIFDYYIGWMFYNGYKTHQYHKYMIQKWGEQYTKRFKD